MGAQLLTSSELPTVLIPDQHLPLALPLVAEVLGHQVLQGRHHLMQFLRSPTSLVLAKSLFSSLHFLRIAKISSCSATVALCAGTSLVQNITRSRRDSSLSCCAPNRMP